MCIVIASVKPPQTTSETRPSYRFPVKAVGSTEADARGVPIEAPERSGHPFIVIHRTASSGTAPEECSECTSKFPR